jgi:EAL domain-containing protein (putative c-di-GMP-specific phosphodiesterase class I)
METTDPFFDIINKNRIELIKTINAVVELDIHFNFNSDFFNRKGASKGTMSLPMKLFGSAKNIVIEITEEYLSENEEAALSVFLDQARENNNKIALDDFPSKQSNLNRLMDYNVDVIKIDKKLISQIDFDNKSKVMLKHIKNMCDNLNIEIIVEGVYSEGIMNTLNNMGIFNHQGFYYHRPMKVSDFLEKMQT